MLLVALVDVTLQRAMFRLKLADLQIEAVLVAPQHRQLGGGGCVPTEALLEGLEVVE